MKAPSLEGFPSPNSAHTPLAESGNLAPGSSVPAWPSRVPGLRILLYPSGSGLGSLASQRQGPAHLRRTNGQAGVAASGSGLPASPPHVHQAVPALPSPLPGAGAAPTRRTLGHAPSHGGRASADPTPPPQPPGGSSRSCLPDGSHGNPQERGHPTPPGRPRLELGEGG